MCKIAELNQSVSKVEEIFDLVKIAQKGFKDELLTMLSHNKYLLAVMQTINAGPNTT